MAINFSAVSIFLLPLLFFPWLISCSKQSSILECYEFIELTPQSIASFTAHLTGDPDDALLTKLRSKFLPNDFYQQLCLKYFVCSAVIFGQVDEAALAVIDELCGADRDDHLPALVSKLIVGNNCDTIVKFIARNVTCTGCKDWLMDLVIELIQEDWKAMKVLIMGVLNIWKNDPARTDLYRHVLRHLPVGQQYDMFDTGSIPLKRLEDIYYVEKFDPLLREVFFLARCAYNPNPHIRSYIADRALHFQQFLPEAAIRDIVVPCPAMVPILDADAWYRIAMFMDVETLLFVLPLVCTAWRKLYLTILTHSTRAHDLYLQDLSYYADLSGIHTIAPWRYFMLRPSTALSYLGLCIADGALSRAKPESALLAVLRGYWKLLSSGRAPIPKSKCGASYGFFLMVFESVYEFCTDVKPIFDRPQSFTDAEYERTVRYFICEKGWTTGITETLIFSNIPKLFRIIDEDEELMKRLVIEKFGNFLGPSVALMMHSQTNDMSEKLLRLIFSQTAICKRLIEPKLVHPSEYHNVIVESDILPELMIRVSSMPQFSQFIISLVLSFKNHPDKIDKIVALIINRIMAHHNPALIYLKWWLDEDFKPLKGGSGYSSEDIQFFRKVMMRCGLLKGPEHDIE